MAARHADDRNREAARLAQRAAADEAAAVDATSPEAREDLIARRDRCAKVAQREAAALEAGNLHVRDTARLAQDAKEALTDPAQLGARRCFSQSSPGVPGSRRARTATRCVHQTGQPECHKGGEITHSRVRAAGHQPAGAEPATPSASMITGTTTGLPSSASTGSPPCSRWRARPTGPPTHTWPPYGGHGPRLPPAVRRRQHAADGPRAGH